MPPDEQGIEKASQSDANGSSVNETVLAQMLSIAGGQHQYVPTQAQVDKLLSLQEKGMEYTHDERTRISLIPSLSIL